MGVGRKIGAFEEKGADLRMLGDEIERGSDVGFQRIEIELAALVVHSGLGAGLFSSPATWVEPPAPPSAISKCRGVSVAALAEMIPTDRPAASAGPTS